MPSTTKIVGFAINQWLRLICLTMLCIKNTPNGVFFMFTGFTGTERKHRCAIITQTKSMPRNTAHNNLEQYDWPSDYAQADVGTYVAEHLTRIRMEAAGLPGITGIGRGHLRGIATGHYFNLAKHPHKASNQDYLVTGTYLSIQEKDRKRPTQPPRQMAELLLSA